MTDLVGVGDHIIELDASRSIGGSMPAAKRAPIWANATHRLAVAIQRQNHSRVSAYRAEPSLARDGISCPEM